MRVSDIRQRRAGLRDGRVVLDLFSIRGRKPLEFSINHIRYPDGPLLHNHAYEYCESLILSGEYTHEFFLLGEDGSPGELKRETYRAEGVNFMPGNCFHRIVEVKPGTMTWMCYGPALPRTREYWVPGVGVVPYREVDVPQDHRRIVERSGP